MNLFFSKQFLNFYLNPSTLLLPFLVLCLFSLPLSAQISVNVHKLNDLTSIPGDLLKKTPPLKYPISYSYKITDNSGTYYTLLCEHVYNDSGNSILIDSIQAFTIKDDNNNFSTQWSLKDFILTDESKSSVEESIWFWTKYSQIADIDNDGLCDFIMVYGSKGLGNDFDDGRLKIIFYYKGRKFAAIRHQNSVEDFGRFTTIDSSFYKLPETIQNKTLSIIANIEKDGYAVFPNNLYDAIKKKLLSVENDY